MPQTPTWEDTVEVPAWEDTAPEGKPSEVKSAPLIKLSPYEQANLESMMAGRGKLPTGMEAGTGLVTAIAEDPERFLQTPLVQIPRIEAKSTLGKIAAAPVNVAGGLIQGMETPLGVLTLGLGGPVAKAAFAGLAAKSAGEQLGTASVTGDPGQIAEGILGAGLGPAIALHRTLPPTPRPFQGPLATGEIFRSPERGVPTALGNEEIQAEAQKQAAMLELGRKVKDLRPAIKTMDGEIVSGEKGQSHNDIIEQKKIPATDVDKREFVDQTTGQELSREQVAAAIPTEKPGEAHSSDLAKAQEGIEEFPEPRPLGEGNTAEQILSEAIDDRSHGDEALAAAGHEVLNELRSKGYDFNRKLSDEEIKLLYDTLDKRRQKYADELEGIPPQPTPPPEPAAAPKAEAVTPPTPAPKVEGRDWGLFNENLIDDLDSFSPARNTGRIDYDMADVADRFVDFAKTDKSGKPLDKLVSDFAKTDDATTTQIRKLRQSVKSVLAQEKPAAPPAPAPAPKAEPSGATPTTVQPKTKSPEAIAASEATQAAFEKLGAAERGAYDKSKRKGMTKAQLAKLKAFDKLVEAERQAKAKPEPPTPPAAEPPVAKVQAEVQPPTSPKLSTALFPKSYKTIAETGASATQKVAGEIQHVARTEGQRSAKEVKSELVSRLEKAVEDAPNSTADYFPGLYVYEAKSLSETTRLTDRPVEGTTPLANWLDKPMTSKDKTPNRNTAMGGRFIAEALTRKGVSKITIEIPGDGTFTIWKTKDAIQGLLDRARKISTKTEEPVKVERVGMSKADREWVEQQLKQPVATEPQAPPPAQGPGMVGPGAQTRGEPPYPAISQLTDQLNQTPKAGLKDSIQLKERVAEQWARGKSIVNRAVARMRAVTESLKDTARGVRTPTELDQKVGQFDWAVQSSAGRSKQAGQAIRRQMPSQTMREAVAIWIDAGGDVNVIRDALANLPEGTRPSVRRAMEQATNLSPEARDFAESLRQFYGIRENDAVSHELFEQGLKDYYTHIWEKEENMPDELRAAFVNGKLSTYFQFARQRKLPTFLDGILLGKTPMLDPAEVIPFYNYAMDRAIASRQFIKDASEVVMPDGRPLLSPSGTRSVVAQGETPDALLIKPKARSEQNADYHQVDHPALRKWKWAGTGESGEPILYQGDLLVHPEGFTRLANMMDRGRLTPSKWGGRLLRLSTEVKGMKLGMLSAFHNIHVGSHAAFHWTNPFKALGKPIDWDAPETRFAVEKGHLKIGPDPAELRIASEGILSPGLIHKFPIIGPISKAWSEWTFGEMIPQLKMATFKNAYDRNLWARDHLPNAVTGLKGLTNEEVSARVGDSVNNAFGELNHLFLGKYGRNPQFQRILRGIFLAPDFGEARLRFAEKAFTKTGFEERLALATMFTTLYLGARVANWLSHGDPEWDWKKAFAVKAGDHWWSMRSVVGDIDHAASDFGRFMYVRLNPLYSRTAADFLFGRDISGRKLTTSQKIGNVFKQLIPIQMGGLTRDDQRLWESFVGAMGLSAQRDRPEGDINKLVADWMSKSTDPKIQLKHQQREGEVFAQSAYAPMRFALEAEDYGKAAEEYQKLLKAKTFSQIDKALNSNLDSMGGLTKPEFRKFLASLTPPQRKLYEQAKANRREIHNRFLKMLAQSK